MCLTTVILAPGACEGGFGAAALAPLCLDPGDTRDTRDTRDWRMNSGRLDLVRWLRQDGPKARNWRSNFDKIVEYGPKGPKGTPKGPKGSPKRAKWMPKSTPRETMAPKRKPKGQSIYSHTPDQQPKRPLCYMGPGPYNIWGPGPI